MADARESVVPAHLARPSGGPTQTAECNFAVTREIVFSLLSICTYIHRTHHGIRRRY